MNIRTLIGILIVFASTSTAFAGPFDVPQCPDINTIKEGGAESFNPVLVKYAYTQELSGHKTVTAPDQKIWTAHMYIQYNSTDYFGRFAMEHILENLTAEGSLSYNKKWQCTYESDTIDLYGNSVKYGVTADIGD